MTSRRTSAGRLSRRKPWNDGCRISVGGPFREGDFRDGRRLHPVRMFAERPGGTRSERASRLFERVESPSQVACNRDTEAGADLARKGEPRLVVV